MEKIIEKETTIKPVYKWKASTTRTKSIEKRRDNTLIRGKEK